MSEREMKIANTYADGIRLRGGMTLEEFLFHEDHRFRPTKRRKKQTRLQRKASERKGLSIRVWVDQVQGETLTSVAFGFTGDDSEEHVIEMGGRSQDEFGRLSRIGKFRMRKWTGRTKSITKAKERRHRIKRLWRPM